MNYPTHHYPNQNKYVVDLENGHQAFLLYRDQEDARLITHTEVPAELRGGGYGKILMESVLAKMEEQGVKVIPICSYARIYIMRNKQWSHMLHQ